MTPLRLFLGVLAGVVMACTGCSSATAPSSPTSSSSAVAAPVAPVAQSVVDAVQQRAKVDLRAADTTAADCPAIGCTQAVTTDQFRVLAFPTTGRAERYAGENGARQIEALAVTFPPSVDQSAQDRWWSEITAVVR
jgi:hypothetical protein